MPNGLIETEVTVGIEMKIIIMTTQEVGVEIDMIVDMFNREERNPGPNSNSRVSTNHDHDEVL